MIQRNRAWRRRKARTIITKVQQTKNWLIRQFKDPNPKPVKSLKQHRIGALTHTQDKRLLWSTQQELRDAA